MPAKQHILICGEPGAGKSTLIRRLLAHSRRPLYGFVTKREPPPGKNGPCLVYLHPASQDKAEWTRGPENLVGAVTQRCVTACPQVFDHLGVQLLQAPENGLILMDELGVLENSAERFRDAVLQTLNGSIPVLAAVKTRDSLFLRQVRGHCNGALYFITPENRDSLYRQLLLRILEWNRKGEA